MKVDDLDVLKAVAELTPGESSQPRLQGKLAGGGSTAENQRRGMRLFGKLVAGVCDRAPPFINLTGP